MASSSGLIRAMEEMKNGSSSGFSTFYRATLQFVYKTSFALWKNNEDVCLFMADYYPYMYMRIGTYKEGEDITQWMSNLLVEKYTLMTGKRDLELDPGINSKNLLMSKDDADRVWHLLEVRIHFPKEDKKAWKKGLEVPIRVLLIVGIISAVALIALWKFGPQIASYFPGVEKEKEVEVELEPSEESKEDTLKQIQDLQDQLDAENGVDKEMTEDEMRELLDKDLSIDTTAADINASTDTTLNNKSDNTSANNKTDSKTGNVTPNMGQEFKTEQTTKDPDSYESKVDSKIGTTKSNIGSHIQVSERTSNNGVDSQTTSRTTVTNQEISASDIKLKYGDGLYFTKDKK